MKGVRFWRLREYDHGMDKQTIIAEARKWLADLCREIDDLDPGNPRSVVLRKRAEFLRRLIESA